MDPSFIITMTFVHALIAIVTTGTNIYVAHRRVRTSSRSDTRRLRATLAAELDILRSTFNSNISALYEQKATIICSRGFSAIYRASLTKLGMLEEDEIAAVVAAYAFCEVIEGFVSAHGRPNGQSSYNMGKERAFANELIALFHKGADLADGALSAMSAANGAAKPAIEILPSETGKSLPVRPSPQCA